MMDGPASVMTEPQAKMPDGDEAANRDRQQTSESALPGYITLRE